MDPLVVRRNDLMAQLILGGPVHRSAKEKFKYRMDRLLDLLDVETALEEKQGAVWYMVVCAQCDGTPPVPFKKDSDRASWVDTHVDRTGHSVVKFEEPR